MPYAVWDRYNYNGLSQCDTFNLCFVKIMPGLTSEVFMKNVSCVQCATDRVWMLYLNSMLYVVWIRLNSEGYATDVYTLWCGPGLTTKMCVRCSWMSSARWRSMSTWLFLT